MIPKNFITEWSNEVPWQSNEQVEQDLVICRALSELFKDDFIAEHLAFRGGTALHKLYLFPQPRYSEDIDLVQIKAEPIKKTIERIRLLLDFVGEPIIKQKANNNTLIFRFESEFEPVMPLRLKVETNCREHFNVLGFEKFPFSMDTQWYKGNCEITTYKLEELLGTKLRALYQRRKGRDLFDLYTAIEQKDLNFDQILNCYKQYISFVVKTPPTKKQFLLNMEEKIQSDEFLGDTKDLLRKGENYNANVAFEIVKNKLIERLE